MNFDAFISYANQDKAAADAACAVLESVGIRCWIAPRDIRPGREFADAIIEAIDHCRVMVLIFSASANESAQIHREIERAVSKGAPIIPVRIEEIAPTKSMAYFLGSIHWLDALTPPLEIHLQHLAETVKAILHVNAGAQGRSVNDSPLTQSAHNAFERVTPGKPVWWFFSAAVLVLVLGGAWFYQFHVPAPTSVPERQASPAPSRSQAEPLVPEMVPGVSDREQASIRANYLPGQDHKALAISRDQARFVTGQKDDETAKAAALDSCRMAIRESRISENKCQLYAVGNTMVFTGPRPPLPPHPWIVRDPLIEKPFASVDVPLVNDAAMLARLEKEYAAALNSKALALSPTGGVYWMARQSSLDEAMRRAVELCGSRSGIPCLIIAVDDVFVVPIPKSMNIVGVFRAEGNTAIAPEARDDLARRLGNATSGWKAVAVGASGRPGVMLRATREQDAIVGAVAECSKQDRECRVISIGPFSVGPKM